MGGQFFRDLRAACRVFRTAPAVSGIIVLSLGVGIGVNAAMFTWVQALVLNPLPGAPGTAPLFTIEPRTENGAYPGASWLEYQDLLGRVTAFKELVAARNAPLNLGQADWSERVSGQLVSGNFFTGLSLSPSAGRLLGPVDTAVAGGAPVAVISHDLWQTRFQGAASAVGQTVRISDRPFTIVGVGPAGFYGSVVGLKFDVWVPATAAPVVMTGSRDLDSRTQRGMLLMGPLADNANRAMAERQVVVAMADLARDYPASNRNVTAEVFAFAESPRGPQRMLLGSILALQGLLLLLLLAVCGNTASLLLVRAHGRRREIGTRLALGAGRWRVASLLLAECLVLAAAGALLGAVVAVWGSTALRQVPMPSPGGMTLQFVTNVDLTTLAFAAALGLVSALIFGLPAAIQLSRIAPGLSTRVGARGVGRNRLRDIIMVTEIAVALVVLLMSAVFIKTFTETQTTNPGFRRDGLLVAAYDLRGMNRPVDDDTSRQFAERLLARLERGPDVARAAIASAVKLDLHGLPSRMFSVEGHSRQDGSLDQALSLTVTPGYFETLDIPFIAGNDFAPLGDPTAPRQAVVNETFVTRLLPNLNPLGRRIDTAGREYTIVGVVKDTKYVSFSEAATPFIYLSFRDRPGPIGEIHARARSGDARSLVPGIRAAVRDVDATVPIYNVRTLTDHVEQNLVFARIPARIFSVLGPLLLVLAGIGIYGVVAYAVTQRTVEIGIRLALGAPARTILAGFMAETLAIVAVGGAVGLGLALALKQAASTVHFDQSLTALFLLVPLLLTAVAAFACWLPARRATRIDPLLALKQE